MVEVVEVPEDITALISLDFSGVLNIHYRDSRAFMDRLAAERPRHVQLDIVCTCFSGQEHARQTRQSMAVEFSGVPVFITSAPKGFKGKGAFLQDLMHRLGFRVYGFGGLGVEGLGCAGAVPRSCCSLTLEQNALEVTS